MSRLHLERADPAGLRRRITPRSGDDLALLRLQASAGNRATAALVARDVATTQSKMDPKQYSSYGAWVQSLPGESASYDWTVENAKVRAEQPELVSLVEDLKADCADVTILLRHYYLQAHGKTSTITTYDSKAKDKRARFKVGKGVSRAALRRTLSDVGTINFQETGKGPLAFIDYYGGSKPIKNLKKILAAGLAPGELLVWKKLAGIQGSFSGHVQTIQRIDLPARVAPGAQGPEREGGIEVLQGTMETGRGGFGELQSRFISFQLLTGDPDGNGEITFQPDSEEEFYGAGRWK